MSLTNKQLQPLYDILPANTDLNSSRYLTNAARAALLLVEQSIQDAALKRRDESKPIALCILPTESQPTGVLWQGALALDTSKDFPSQNTCLLLRLSCSIGFAWYSAKCGIFWHSARGFDSSILC